MTDAVETTATEEPAVPTDADLAYSPVEHDPYIRDRQTGKFVGKKHVAGDEEKPEPEPEKPTEEEPPPPAAKPEEEKTEEERAPAAKELLGLKKQRKWISQQRSEIERQLAEVRAAQDRQRHLDELWKTDKAKWAKEAGYSVREIIEDAARDGEQDPKEQELKALRAELAELKNFREELTKERQTTAQQKSYEDDRAAAEHLITSAGDQYPYLNAYGAAKASQYAANIWTQRVQEWEAGKAAKPVPEEIFEELETQLREDYERMTSVRAPKANGSASLAASAKSPERANGAVKDGKARGAPARETPPATLTNRTAAERASPDRALTRDERRRLAASRLVIRE